MFLTIEDFSVLKGGKRVSECFHSFVAILHTQRDVGIDVPQTYMYTMYSLGEGYSSTEIPGIQISLVQALRDYIILTSCNTTIKLDPFKVFGGIIDGQ